MEKYANLNDTDKTKEAQKTFADNHYQVFDQGLNEYCQRHPDEKIECGEKCTADLYNNLVNATLDDKGNNKNCSGE